MKKWVELIKTTIQDWNEDKAPRLAAALAYYTVFSIAPFLVVVIAIAGLALGQDAVQEQVMGQISSLVGQEGASMVGQMIEGATKPAAGIFAAIIGLITLVFGAIGVLAQLKDALNTIWEVPPKPGGGVIGFIRQNVLSLAMLLGIGFMLLVSLVASTAISAIGNYFIGQFPAWEAVLQVVNQVLAFLIVTLLFALMFKFLPDTEIAWRDVWIGAAVTSLLFNIGKFVLGLYLGNSGVASAYGAAGSLVVLLLWIYYSAQIFLLGGEFTQAYARLHGSRVGQQRGAAQQASVVSMPDRDRPRLAAVAMGAVPDADLDAVPLPKLSAKNRLVGLVTMVVLMVAGWLLGGRGKRDEQASA